MAARRGGPGGARGAQSRDGAHAWLADVVRATARRGRQPIRGEDGDVLCRLERRVGVESGEWGVGSGSGSGSNCVGSATPTPTVVLSRPRNPPPDGAGAPALPAGAA